MSCTKLLPALTQLLLKSYKFYIVKQFILTSCQGRCNSQTTGLLPLICPFSISPPVCRMILLKLKPIRISLCLNFPMALPISQDSLNSSRPRSFLEIGLYLLQFLLILYSPIHSLWKCHTGPEFQEFLFYFVLFPSMRKGFLPLSNLLLPTHSLRINLGNTSHIRTLLSSKPTSTQSTVLCMFYYVCVFPTRLYISWGQRSCHIHLLAQ